jgi:hypothetical protein
MRLAAERAVCGCIDCGRIAARAGEFAVWWLFLVDNVFCDAMEGSHIGWPDQESRLACKAFRSPDSSGPDRADGKADRMDRSGYPGVLRRCGDRLDLDAMPLLAVTSSNWATGGGLPKL